MRMAMMGIIVVLALVGWAVVSSNEARPAPAEGSLILIPTAYQELTELRVNTGERAPLADGKVNAVYVKKIPSEGSVYLNFHVDVSSAAGPFVLHTSEIFLESGEGAARVEKTGSEKPVSAASADACYTPMDWFIDTGLAEVRGDSLTVVNKGVVQFTIEVPRAGLEDLTLFIRDQRIGTVREIRERVAGERTAN